MLTLPYILCRFIGRKQAKYLRLALTVEGGAGFVLFFTVSAPERIMLFRAEGALYGIGIGAVRRVLSERFVTPIPLSLPEVAGAILFEGQAVPVFHVRAPGSTHADSLILMLQHESSLMGLAIENVLRVIEPEEAKFRKGKRKGSFEGATFSMITPDELIPSGLEGPRGGKNDQENPAGR